MEKNYQNYSQEFVVAMCEGTDGGTGDEGGTGTGGESGTDTGGESGTDTGQPLAPCDGWDPASHVSVNGSVIEIDEAFVDAILDDPSELVYCDDAIIEISGASPVYSIDDIGSGDLADELGLLDEDVFYSVNGRSLATKTDVIDAFLELRLAGETELDLTIYRGSVPVVLNYELVP